MTMSHSNSQSRLLFILLAFVTLGSLSVNDAFGGRSRTVGGTTTDLHDHNIRVACTWPNFEGGWEADPGSPITVSHSAGDEGEYATCSGWTVDGGVSRYDDGTIKHDEAPGGQGKFKFNITYTSTSTTTCIEDPNSGIGNNCVKFTDKDNKNGGNGKAGGGNTPTTGATVACKDNFPGTTTTYQFYCADGVKVTGYLTLVPTLGGNAQVAPEFTGPCSPARVAAGACTIQYGGIPMKTIKVKGQEQMVVDQDVCLEAFPQASVNNALNSGQTQNLQAGAILFYQETAYTGSCADLDTGSPTAAYGRYCQSDIDTFQDNVSPNLYEGDLEVSNDGFDNELRVCEQSDNPPPHTGDQDVETVELTNITVTAQPTLNLNCTTGGNTDSGKFKVYISDQSQLLAGNIEVTPLSKAPTLEGVSPLSAVISTDDFGVDTLTLTYPTCEDLSANVITNNSLDRSDNNTNVFLEFSGQTIPTSTSLEQAIKEMIEVKVNGL